MGESVNGNMESGPTIHVVEAGEHLSSIADSYGFQDYRQIWDSEANAKLREERKDPHQLVPGDRLAIPARHVVTYQRQTGQIHTFSVYVEKLKLRLKLLDATEEPLANTPCKLKVDSAESEVATDGDGFVELKIRRSAKRAELTVLGQTYALGIGHMTPAEEDSGVHRRLRNLGYLTMAEDGVVSEAQLTQALREFQAANGLEVSGQPDQTTRDKLVVQHGC